MSIKYIQFRHDVVVAVGGATRSFNAWTPDKHGDFCQPEETPYGVTLHAIETHTKYEKGVAIKDVKRTGRRWRVPTTSIAFIADEDDKQKAKA
jgi:hypothetical protein